MTRTGVMASSRPEAARETKSGARGRMLGRLAILPVLALLALVVMVPATAMAAGSTSESTSGYNKEPETPAKEPEAAKEKEATKTTSTTTPTTEKATTLPFTGFDLRWSVGLGLLLIGMGASIVVVQRRRAGADRR